MSAVGNILHKRKSPNDELDPSAQAHITSSSLRRLVESVGSIKIFLFRLVQLLSVLALLVLSVLAPLRDASERTRIFGPFAATDVVQIVLFVRVLFQYSCQASLCCPPD